MKIRFTILLLIVLKEQGNSQPKVSDFKKIADKAMAKYLNEQILAKVSCEQFNTVSLDRKSTQRYLSSSVEQAINICVYQFRILFF